jgi:ubiquinone/menaquinone biosynthesis C-methylase UbiE
MTDNEVVPNHHRGYPGFSGLFGLTAATTMLVGRRSDAEVAAELARLTADDIVVDIGCGPGAAARHAARCGAAITGVDPAPVMLRMARLLTASPNVTYLEGTAEQLPLPEDAATVIWSIATVHHWHDLDRGLSEVRRVLRPNGRFIAIEHRTMSGATGHASHGWTDQQADAFVQCCRDEGLIDPRVERRTHKPRRSTLAVTATAS